jgi:hypothetical protein
MGMFHILRIIQIQIKDLLMHIWAFIVFHTRTGIQALYLEQLHHSFFCVRYFRDSILRTICLGWLQTTILLISASWVASVTGVSHWRPAWAFIFICASLFVCPSIHPFIHSPSIYHFIHILHLIINFCLEKRLEGK